MRPATAGVGARLFGRESPWPWIIIATLAVLPHLRAIGNPFVFDDWSNIPNNPYMVAPGALRTMFGANVWAFAGPAAISDYYRPLMHLFHYGVFQIAGAAPGAYHAFCLLLHVFVSLAVAHVVTRLSQRREVGVLAALLFAVHPVHSEVVAWISCSPELLCALFSLLAFSFYLAAAERSGWPRIALACAAGASALLAQLSKEIGVLLPVVIVAYELLVKRLPPGTQIRSRAVEYAALSVATAVYFAARFYALGGLGIAGVRQGLSWAEHLWTALAIFYRYLAVIVWPVELNFFRYDPPSRSPLEPAVIGGIISLAAVLALGVFLYRRRAPEVLAPAMYLLWLLPVVQLPYLSTGLLVFERAAYLPSVGFCWLVAAGICAALEKFRARTAVAVLTIALLAGYAARSAARMNDWSDEVEFFNEGLARGPSDPFLLHVFRAHVALRHGRPVEALASLAEAMRSREDADAHSYAGRAYTLLRQYEPALRHYRRAAEMSMQDGHPGAASRAWNNIGVVYRTLDRNEEAITAYRQALRLDPESASTRNNLGFALLLEKQVEEAIEELRAAIAQDPALSQAHANIGLGYAMQGRHEAALGALAQAEKLDPWNPEVQARIGEVHAARGNRVEARRRFERALRLQPDNGRARAGMAAL